MLGFIKKNINIFNKSQIIFIISVLVYIFFISCDYALVRPASESLIISYYTSKIFPYCWLVGVPFNFLIVYLYNKYLPKFKCLKTFLVFSVSIIIVNTLSAFFSSKFHFLIFFQFIFKDVYILLAFKQIWSMIHSTIDFQKSKFLYGIIAGFGGIGSIFGGLVSGFFVSKIQTINLFLFSTPIYMLVFLFYFIALKNSSIKDEDFKLESETYSKKGFSLIKKSPYLTYILFIVIFMQLSTAFIDYQFNIYLEKSISNVDLRTAFLGKLTCIINSISTSIQFFLTFVIVRYFGLKKSHLSIPFLLAFNSIVFFIYPSFTMISYAYTTIKSLDYSFFNIIREMLYIPLTTDEKYRAKALIDVFVHRSAKAFAAFFLIFIQHINGLNILLLISIISMVVYFIWMRVISTLFDKHYQPIQGE